MKERLIQLLDLEQLTPSKFADLIGVQRSSVSHVLSGRNKPSFDFLQKTLKAFPGLSAEWLMLGKGKMYEHMGQTAAGTLFDSPKEMPERNEEFKEDDQGLFEPPEPVQEEVEAEKPDDRPKKDDNEMRSAVTDREREHHGYPSRRVVRVMIFYEDDTFKSFEPSL